MPESWSRGQMMFSSLPDLQHTVRENLNKYASAETY